MAVKVTGQFVPAGEFSIVDGKDVSGHITGSNISGSATGTGSFGSVHTVGNVGLGIKNVAMTDPTGGSRTLHIHKDGSDSAAALRFTTGDTGTAPVSYTHLTLPTIYSV